MNTDFRCLDPELPARSRARGTEERPPVVPTLFVSLAVALLVATASAAKAQTIEKFAVPQGDGAPGSIVAGPDGALWFTETYGFIPEDGRIVQPSAIGRITTDGVFTRFPLPTPSSLPTSITLAPDGNLWFAEYVCATSIDCSAPASKIGRITTAGVITEFASPLGLDLTVGPDGNLWFLESDGFFSSTPPSRIGRINLDGTLLGDIEVPGSRLGGLASGPDGAIWFTDSGLPARVLPGRPPFPCVRSKIGRVTTGGNITEYELPSCDGLFLARITVGPDRNLWFTEGRGPGIGRIDPISHLITEFPLPHANAGSVSIVQGPDGNIWFTENGIQGIGRITPAGVVTEFPAAVLSSDITAGPDGAVWFTEFEDYRIGRIETGATGPCAPDAHSLCLRSGRFRVTATYRNPSSSGAAAAIGLSDTSGFFTFVDPGNVELVVKVLNGCRLTPPRFWVYAAGLTHQETTLSVTDTRTGEHRDYFNPLGTTYVTVADTDAFSTCP